ncbi:MAG: glycosyltransferase family 4 protein [Rhodobacterales bacterium]|jgi:colanic acid/amylovoran biosynthesis glycosyltransferase
MRVLYITKNLPYGADEAFIYAEVDDHLNAGWDVAIVPVRKMALVHDDGRKLLSRTWGRGLIDPAIVAGFAAELLRQPVLVLSVLGSTIDHRRPGLWPRNMAVWAKGVWLGRQARRWQADHIHVHWIAVPATMALIAARVSGIPFSITAHRYDIAQGNIIHEKSRHAKFIRAIDRVGAVEITAKQAAAQFAPLLLRMGVNFPEAPAVLQSGPLPRLRALIAARMIAKKGHETLFRSIAAARHDGIEVMLDLLGEGPLEGHLQQLAGKLAIADLITFGGVVSHNALMRRLSSGDYDLAVLPSVTALDGDKEGIPVFLMEAMGAGLPVIATDNGGIAELVIEGSGLLVPEYDVPALSEALVQLARDGELRMRLAAAGRAQVIENFDLRNTGRRLRQLMSTETAPRVDF